MLSLFDLSLIYPSGDEIPADMIILTSSEENGIAYINTMNLDGETNLKIKRSHPSTFNVLCLNPYPSLSSALH